MLLSWNSLKTASSFPCSRGWLTIWLYLSWSQSASILIHSIINGHTERERTCVAKDSRKCHSYGRPWWVEFPRSRYWKPMRKGRDVKRHFVPELFLFTLSPDSLDRRTRCVTAHTKLQFCNVNVMYVGQLDIHPSTGNHVQGHCWPH